MKHQKMIYNKTLEKIRQDLVEEVKKILPLNYDISNLNKKNVSIDKQGMIKTENISNNSSFYIVQSVDCLSLSHLALLIDDFHSEDF